MKAPQKGVQGIPVAVGQWEPSHVAGASECDGAPLVDDTDGDAVTGTPLFSANDTRASGGRFMLQGYQDVWAAVAFLLCFLASMAVFAVHAQQGTLEIPHAQQHGAAPGTPAPTEAEHHRGDIKMWAALAVALGLSAGAALMALLRAFPMQFIVVSNVIMAAYICVAALFAVAGGLGLNSLMLVALAAFNLLWLYMVRDRIPFSSALLKYAADVIFRYKATVFVSLAGMALLAGYLVAVLLTISPWVPDVQTTKLPNGRIRTQTIGGHPGLVILFVFFMFWSIQVAMGVVHVTVCGVSAAAYFFDQVHMPRNPTLSSFKRATTTSFGSVCFGGLIVAVIQTIRFIVESMRDDRAGAIACLVDCILSCLEGLMQYFNKWAFAQVAIYGRSFTEAARACFRLMRTGDAWEGVVSECLVFRALFLAAVVGGFATGCICGLGAGSVAVGVLSGIIGFSLCRVMVTAIDSSVIALFVCYAEAPERMQQARPELHQIFRQTLSGWDFRQQSRDRDLE